jgi:hypothetical protein
MRTSAYLNDSVGVNLATAAEKQHQTPRSVDRGFAEKLQPQSRKLLGHPLRVHTFALVKRQRADDTVDAGSSGCACRRRLLGYLNRIP